jgi:predicted PurR-regulated permease PerM
VSHIKLKFPHYVFIAFLLVLIYLSYQILEPFIISILSSFVIAFIFYPLYKRLLKRIKSENASSLLISLLIILIITVPTFFMLNAITKEMTTIYDSTTIKLIQDENLIGFECEDDTTLCNLVASINKDPKIRFYITGGITNVASAITRETSSFLFSVPKRIIDVLIIFLLVFFLLKSGGGLWKKTKELFPLKKNHKGKLAQKFGDTINGVVYGYLVIALIEAIIAWFAFSLIGLKAALLLGILVGILGLIPMIGAPIIWVPLSVVYLFSGAYTKVIILVIAGIIIMFLDIWARAKIIGDRTDIHPAVIALGVLGGTITFGAVGVVIGPLILSLLITSLDIYREEKHIFSH